jgi:hypothetical protein
MGCSGTTQPRVQNDSGETRPLRCAACGVARAAAGVEMCRAAGGVFALRIAWVLMWTGTLVLVPGRGSKWDELELGWVRAGGYGCGCGRLGLRVWTMVDGVGWC